VGNYLSGVDPAVFKIGKNMGNAGRVVSDWSEVQAANNLIAILQEKGILKEITGQSRNRIFAFEPYLELFRHDTKSNM